MNNKVDCNVNHDINKNNDYNIRKQRVINYHNKVKNAWPVYSSNTSQTIQFVLNEFEKCIFEKEISEQQEYSIKGRIIHIREHGKSIFIDIEEENTHIQGYLKNEPGTVSDIVKQYLDLGDIVLITGILFYTKTKEKTIRIKNIDLLSKCLHSIPSKHIGLENIELRYRKRYLDLLVNNKVKDIFVKRSLIIQYIRNFLNNNGYLEVETPMLHSIAGGAFAKPFITHHNALDMDLFLRIAPELFLKRLIVAGFSKVYEINKNFRNEGISVRHNPEFTMLEFYTAYQDYNWAMGFIENMIRQCSLFINNTLSITWNSHRIDLSQNFDRLTAYQAILKYTSFKEIDLTPERISSLIPPEKSTLSYDEKIFFIFEEHAEKHLIQPTFLINFPISISPLAKADPHNPHIASRFELFMCGMEISNGYDELNNPFDQEERFKDQMIKKEKGDSEAMNYDKDFIEALEYGMPPTAGVGIGIDRLCMLLTDAKSIKDVILFPTMKNIDE